MLIVPLAVLHQYFFGIAMFLISTFLILLVLVQRGRGGGLAGALGGPGGGSVFGSKAGDVFTKITIITAGLWIFTCASGVWWMQKQDNPLSDVTTPSTSMGDDTGAEEPAGFDPTLPGSNLVPSNPIETTDPVPPAANPAPSAENPVPPAADNPSEPSPTPPASSGN